jgi:hypothetical protein
MVCDGDQHPVEIVVGWLQDADSALLALDAPLGWPAATAEPIPLAWDIPLRERVEAIEVYPAATMLVRGGSLRGYKKPGAESARTALLDTLAPACDFQGVMEAAVRNHDCLDALACVVAGIDFLEGNAVGPRDLDIPRREGWIWFREPGHG